MILDSAICSKRSGPNQNDTSSSEDSEYEEAREQADQITALKEPLLPGGTIKTTWRFWERNKYTFFIFMLMCTEWGDVSQIVAIGLAAKYGVVAIIIGGGIAHILSIFIAILLGSFVHKLLNEKWMNLIAGALFIGFAVKEIYSLVTE